MYTVFAGKEKPDEVDSLITDFRLLDEIESNILFDSVLDEIPVHVASEPGTGEVASGTHSLSLRWEESVALDTSEFVTYLGK